MKKKYINYLLAALVLSLCILVYVSDTEGFQASPVDLKNFTGRITALRVKPMPAFGNDPGSGTASGTPSGTSGTASGTSENNDVMEVLGEMIGISDITNVLENCIGDSIYVNVSPPESSNRSINTFIFPEMYAALTINDMGVPTTMDPNKAPIMTLNLDKSTSARPIILTNQNISVIFNNISANLAKNNLKILSIVLNNSYEFPENACVNVPRPVLDKKIIVNSNTAITGMTIDTDLVSLQAKLPIISPQYNSGAVVSTVDAMGNETVLDIRSMIEAGIRAGSNDAMTEAFTLRRRYKISNIPATYFLLSETTSGIMEGRTNIWQELPAATKAYINSVFHTGSGIISESTIQSRWTMAMMSYSWLVPKANVISFHLDNPSQDVSLTTSDNLSLLAKLKTLFFPH